MMSGFGPPLCTHAPDPVSPETLRWTPNRFALGFWGAYVRPPREYPGAGSDPTWAPGYAELLTDNSVRMVVANVPPYAEVCAKHRGRWTLDQDGYAVAVACNETLDEEYPRNVFARGWVANQGSVEATENAGLRLGSAYWVGAYRTPSWVETIVSAPAERCGGGLG